MRNRNAVRHAAQNFVIAIAIMILAGCGQNPGGDYTSSSPILPAVADTVGSSLDLTIPLDVAVAASNPQRFAVRGKYIAIDPGSTGQANLRLNSISDTARLAYPGSTFNPGSFTDLYFDYQAQPGKFMHVLYGDSPDILSSGTKSISDPALPNTIFRATINAFGTTGLILAANNPNGIKILGGTLTLDVIGNGDSFIILQSVNGANIYKIGMLGFYVPTLNALQSETLIIPQIYIPPGDTLSFVFGNSLAPTSAQASYFINAQIL